MTTQHIPHSVLTKEEHLKALLKGYGILAIAYSGGVDSAYLACIAHEVLGEDGAACTDKRDLRHSCYPFSSI